MLDYAKMMDTINKMLKDVNTDELLVDEDDGFIYSAYNKEVTRKEFVRDARILMLNWAIISVTRQYREHKEGIEAVLSETHKHSSGVFFLCENEFEKYVCYINNLSDDESQELYTLYEMIVSICLDMAHIFITTGNYNKDRYYSRIINSAISKDWSWTLHSDSLMDATLIKIDGIKYKWLNSNKPKAVEQNKTIGLQILKLAQLIYNEFKDKVK